MAFQFNFATQESDSFPKSSNAVVAVVRKRGRCDSDLQGRPEKMYKGHEDTDTDTEMEGSMSASSALSASSSSARVVSDVCGSLPNYQQSWKRDEEFYMEDGSCVLLVGDTLFNVSH